MGNKTPSRPEDLYGSLGDFEVRRAGHFRALWKMLRRGGPFLLLDGLPGNTGDKLIWSGSRRVALRSGLLAGLYPARLGAGGIPRGSRLVIPGSGALVGPYSEWLPQLIIDASRRAREVVILPSQAEPSVALVRQALEADNVVFFARDATTWAAVNDLTHRGLSFDPALFSPLLTRLFDSRATENPRRSTLVCLRSDHTGLALQEGKKLSPGVNRDLSAKRISPRRFVDDIRRHREVITDRLHVAVVATLAGSQVRIVDPYLSKISSYMSYVFPEVWGSRVTPIAWEELEGRGIIVRTPLGGAVGE